MYMASNGLAVAVVAKSGAQSVTQTLGAGWYINNEQALYYPERLFFIRHPIRRLESAFNFFKTLEVDSSIYDKFDVSTTPTWEDFVDHVLSGADDEHWTPQVDSLYFKGDIFTPTQVMQFEDINKWWPDYFPTNLKWLNASVPQRIIPYRNVELINYYADDFAKWLSARVFDGIQGQRRWP